MSRLGRSRGGKQGGSPVSLFPFLSVLICTMGLLILLLVVINHHARTQAAERAGIKTKEIIAELDVEAQTLAMFAGDLQKSKELTIADINNESARIATLEKINEEIVLEIQRAEAALERHRNNSHADTSETGKLADTLAAKRETLRRTELELKELRENAAERKSSYAIIPYRGQSGTERRPVYIECRNDCVIIQPEGIVLREDDFLTASHPDNPLDAILRAASLYYTEQELVPRGTKPYPLILVRPDGIDAYYAVRESIQSWGEHFGYELVEEDWTLEFPPPNEALKQRLEMQLAASRERMIPIKMMLMQQLTAANRLSGDIMGGRSPGLPGGGMTGGGFPNGGMPGQGATPGGRGNSNENSSGSGFENVNWQDVMATAGGMSGAGQSQRPNVEYRVGPNGNMVRYVDGMPSEARVAVGNSQRANNPGQSGLTSQQGAQPDMQVNLQPGVPGTYPATVVPQYAANTAQELTVMQPGQLYSETMPNGGMPGSDAMDGMAASGTINATANAMTTSPQEDNISISPNLFARQPGDATAIAANPDMPQPAEQFSEQFSGGIPASMNSGNHDNMMSSDGAMPTLGMTLGDVPPMPANMRPPAANWAMPNVGTGATEMARPINVECRTDKILIRRASGTGIDRDIEIPPNGSVYHVTNTLVSHVLDYIGTWGTAARGTYWQPEMYVTVHPGAEARYDELKALMQNSGVRIRRK